MNQCIDVGFTRSRSHTELAQLQEQFRQSPYWSLRQLSCEADDGRVVLRGTLPSFYLKQVAQSVALKTVGVGCIQSDIDVQPEV